MHFFDRDQKKTDIPLDRPESDSTARKIAESAVVLLKNENNVLPLSRDRIHRIAVYGPNGRDTPESGGGSGEVHPFHNVSFLDGIRAAAGEAIQVTYVPMPTPDEKIFKVFAYAHTSVGGPAGFNVRVKEGRDWSEDPGQEVGRQPSINLDWMSRGAAPLGVTRSKIATITYSGVLQVEKAGDYQLYIQASEARVATWINGKPVTDGAAIHLEPGRAPSIRVQVRLVDWPPAHYCRVGIAEPITPDLSSASNADAVVACCGFRADSEHEAADRDFDLPACQQRLVAALRRANPKTVLIINSGGGTGLNDGADTASAILQAWYLGQAGGTALGEILFGDVNPSGRLPQTFDRFLADDPAMTNYPGKNVAENDHLIEPYTEGLYSGYRGYDKLAKKPRFPFGFGLSYSSYSFKNLVVSSLQGGGGVAALDVTNTGRRAGAEVVQLYVGQPSNAVDHPLRELKGFSKVRLDPGTSQRVTIPLPRDSFAYWSSDQHAWQVDAGTYTIEAGTSERDILAKAAFDVK